MHPQRPSVTLRPATPADVRQVNVIYTHFILHTSITFVTAPVPDSTILARYSSIVEQQHLPFLVATLPHNTNDIDDSESGPNGGSGDTIVGYAHATAYRPDHPAYLHTVEMTIFVHPDYQSRHVGSALISRLLAELRSPKDPKAPLVTEVLACMAVDDQGPRKGLALRDWYLKQGFEEKGRLNNVGWKFGRWSVIGWIDWNIGERKRPNVEPRKYIRVDVLFMQTSFEDNRGLVERGKGL